MKYEPLNDNVLLEMLEQVPEMYRCRVLRCGPGMPTYDGKLVPMPVKAGDIVVIARYPVTWIFEGEKKLLLIHAHRIRLLCNEEKA